MSADRLRLESSNDEAALEIPDGVSSRDMLESMRKNDVALRVFEEAIAKAISLARRRLEQRPSPIPVKASYRIESHVLKALAEFQAAIDFTCELGHPTELTREQCEQRVQELRKKLDTLRARRKR